MPQINKEIVSTVDDKFSEIPFQLWSMEEVKPGWDGPYNFQTPLVVLIRAAFGKVALILVAPRNMSADDQSSESEERGEYVPDVEEYALGSLGRSRKVIAEYLGE